VFTACFERTKFYYLHIYFTFQTGSGTHPASYLIGKRGGGAFYPVVKQPGCEADHSPPTSAEVKKTWIYTSTLPYVVWAYGVALN
jgi:hypothetical protein